MPPGSQLPSAHRSHISAHSVASGMTLEGSYPVRLIPRLLCAVLQRNHRLGSNIAPTAPLFPPESATASSISGRQMARTMTAISPSSYHHRRKCRVKMLIHCSLPVGLARRQARISLRRRSRSARSSSYSSRGRAPPPPRHSRRSTAQLTSVASVGGGVFLEPLSAEASKGMIARNAGHADLHSDWRSALHVRVNGWLRKEAEFAGMGTGEDLTRALGRPTPRAETSPPLCRPN